MGEMVTRSTSPATAKANPIILRGGGERDRIRLVFVPMIVDNPSNPDACVQGDFVYEKKAQRDVWIPIKTVQLSALRQGEGYTLHLSTQELLKVVERVSSLYRLHADHGLPMGERRWVSATGPVGKLLVKLETLQLQEQLDSESEDAANALYVLLKWLSRSPHRPEAIAKLMRLDAGELPTLNAILGLTALKEALAYWRQNQTNGQEGFWKQSFRERAYVLSQVFVFPVIVIDNEAYVGGKQIDNKGGNVVDFLAKIESTGQAVLIEIKTPKTKLLGPRYRNNVYPFSEDLAGGIAQALKYRQSFISDSDGILRHNEHGLIVGAPPCLLIAGNAGEELVSTVMRDDFELLRDHSRGVTLMTYDELFQKLQRTISLLEGTAW
jgi:Domain of unknown function (DUF4263)